jgi:Protein of unknown function (DUF4242)
MAVAHGGTLGTICIYQATDVDKVREHAQRVDVPADECSRWSTR